MTDVVGQATVGKRDIVAAFQHQDFGIFRKAPQAGGRCRAAGHTADNYDFHLIRLRFFQFGG